MEIANDNGVPVYEDNSLATVLSQLNLGAEIPEELYKAVVISMRISCILCRVPRSPRKKQKKDRSPKTRWRSRRKKSRAKKSRRKSQLAGRKKQWINVCFT